MSQQAIRHAFNQAAIEYDGQADVQRQALERLVAMVQPLAGQSPTVLDVGCGTGYLNRYLHQQSLDWRVVSTDIAEEMCKQVNSSDAFVSRMEQLPVCSNSIDVLVTSLALQWSQNIEQTFIHFFEVLKPSGIVAISVLIDRTLNELKSAFKSVDEENHTRSFHRFSDIKNALERQSFVIEMEKRQTIIRQDATVRDLMTHLKLLGAHHLDQRRKGLMTPRQLQQLESAYPKTDGKIESSWEVGYLIARTL